MDSSYLRRLDKGSDKGGSITVWESGDTFKKKRAGEKVHRVCSHNNLRSRTAGRGCQANHTSYSIYTAFKLWTVISPYILI